jgi:nucleoside transporter
MTYFKLSLMMFLQFFVWGAWFTTLDVILSANALDGIIADSFGTAPLAAIIAPLFLGLIADRFFPSQIVMGALFLLGGAFMLLAANAAHDPESAKFVLWMFTGHMLCYMPTLGLSNTIAFAHLDAIQFPRVRVWGTIGWIVAGLLGGFMGWSTSLNMFYVAGIAALLLGVLSFALPSTPPPAKDQPISLRGLLMVDSFKLLLKPAFFVFMLCSFLICIPLAYYYAKTPDFLLNSGFEQPASTMSLGQMSEIFFMLLIPFFFRRLGVKWMIIIGMLAWVARYALFAFGAPNTVAVMMYAGIILHGICYDFFFVTGFMYTENVAPQEIRGQAQSMLVFFTQGLGMFIGYKIAFGVWTLPGQTVPVVTSSGDLKAMIESARPQGDLTYVEKLQKMFSVDIPEQVQGSELLSETMGLWKGFWLFPTLMAAAITALFFVAFWDKIDIDEVKAPDEKA